MGRAHDAGAMFDRIITYAQDNMFPAIPPPVQMPKARNPKGRKPLSACIEITDLHGGVKTPTHNSTTIPIKRQRLVSKTLAHVADKRLARPVDHMHVFIGGDTVHGEKVGRNMNLDEFEVGVKRQVFEITVPTIVATLRDLAASFRKVTVSCVRGNHGRGDNFAASSSNWDLVVYEVVKSTMRDCPNVDIRISEFHDLVDVQGTRFFSFHGNQVRMNKQIPIYGIQAKVASWYKSLGPFDVAVLGHFHTAHDWTYNKVRHIVGGCWPIDDNYTVEEISRTPSTSQPVWFVHPDHGVLDYNEIEIEDPAVLARLNNAPAAEVG